MVSGFTKFKERFQGFENQYVIIGGTACDLIMDCLLYTSKCDESNCGNNKVPFYRKQVSLPYTMVLPCPIAVSYTHLDVYKRQFIYSAIIHIAASKYCISNTAVT